MIRPPQGPFKKRTPLPIWIVSVLALILAILPVFGIAKELAEIPHTGKGCGRDESVICGDQGTILWLSSFGLVALLAIFLVIVLAIYLGYRSKFKLTRCWPALLTLVGSILLLLATFFLIFRATGPQ